MHPLFGRIFTIISISRQPKGPGNILVRYNELMLLRIPIAATTLGAPITYQARTKLNLSAVKELLAIAMDCGALCLNAQETSGKESQTPCKSKSCKTSHSFVRS